MATTSTIAVEHLDGRVTQVYCHWDGYIAYNGRILQEYYPTLSLAEELVSYGSLSILGERITPIGPHGFYDPPEPGTCVFHARDRGEELIIREYRDYDTYQEEYDPQCFNYIFRNGRWYVDGEWLKKAIKKDSEDT